MRPMIAVAAVATLLLAGCAGAHNVSIAGQGSKEGTATKSLDCSDGGGQIAVGIQGQGKVIVSVTDGGGQEIYKNSFSGGGQEGETSSLEGAEGTWTMRASFSGDSDVPGVPDGGFQGQWGITLSC